MWERTYKNEIEITEKTYNKTCIETGSKKSPE